MKVSKLQHEGNLKIMVKNLYMIEPAVKPEFWAKLCDVATSGQCLLNCCNSDKEGQKIELTIPNKLKPIQFCTTPKVGQTWCSEISTDACLKHAKPWANPNPALGSTNPRLDPTIVGPDRPSFRPNRPC